MIVLALPACGVFRRTPSGPPGPAPAAAGKPATTNPSSLLVAPLAAGKVASVNLQARFAVLIFPIGQVPPANTRLVVYHGDAKTGEITVTGPASDNLTVGDIVLGTVEKDDDVRTN